jgi:hypothetical protein
VRSFADGQSPEVVCFNKLAQNAFAEYRVPAVILKPGSLAQFST